MADLGGRQLVERYVNALLGDQEVLRGLRHEQFVEDWPQSGERVRGHDRMARIEASYPGGMPTSSVVGRVVGGQRVLTPSFILMRITGADDVYTALARAAYPDGSNWFVTMFVELRDARIFKVTTLFAPELEPPVWRAQWVERIG